MTDAVTTWRERQVRLLACRQRLVSAQAAHQQRESARDAAWAAYSEYAGLHAFPLRGLDELATALHTYQLALSFLESALELLNARQTTLATAGQTVASQQALRSRAAEEVHALAEGDHPDRTARDHRDRGRRCAGPRLAAVLCPV